MEESLFNRIKDYIDSKDTQFRNHYSFHGGHSIEFDVASNSFKDYGYQDDMTSGIPTLVQDFDRLSFFKNDPTKLLFFGYKGSSLMLRMPVLLLPSSKRFLCLPSPRVRVLLYLPAPRANDPTVILSSEDLVYVTKLFDKYHFDEFNGRDSLKSCFGYKNRPNTVFWNSFLSRLSSPPNNIMSSRKEKSKWLYKFNDDFSFE